MLAKAPPSTSHSRRFLLSNMYIKSLERLLWGTEATSGVPPCRFPLARVAGSYDCCSIGPWSVTGIVGRYRPERLGPVRDGSKVASRLGWHRLMSLLGRRAVWMLICCQKRV